MLGVLFTAKTSDLKMDRATRFISTNNIESIPCRRCRSTARLIRREPLPADVVGEMLTFKCEKCGKESKTIVQG
jgi:Zn finger protein HypA/HybF involved in hydrogenase expression